MKRKYTSPPGYHRHRCYDCGCVWEHSDSCHGDYDSHECPCCGSRDFMTNGFHYHGPRRPTVSFPEEARPCEK